MERERKYAKFIGARYFSNKKYGIRVALYDHGMARASIIYKKRRVNLWHCGEHHMASDRLTFDECKYECVWDYFECCNYLRESKPARKWFRKTLQSCLEPFVLPNGDISIELAEEYDNVSRGRWYGYFDEIDTHLFDREDLFADDKIYDYKLVFWNKEDDFTNLNWVNKSPYPNRRMAPDIYIHCDLERLREISKIVAPDTYNRLADKYGEDKIEEIHLRVHSREIKEEKPYDRIFRGDYHFLLPSVADFWEIPRDYDEKVERIISKW